MLLLLCIDLIQLIISMLLCVRIHYTEQLYSGSSCNLLDYIIYSIDILVISINCLSETADIINHHTFSVNLPIFFIYFYFVKKLNPTTT